MQLRSSIHRAPRLALTAALLYAAAGGAAAHQDSGEPADPKTSGEAVLLRLRGGGIQWARIEAHGPDVLTIRRLENGGLVELPWSFLDVAQEEALRTRFGYVEVENEEPMTQGHVLILMDGTELVGQILSADSDLFTLKQETGNVYVRKSLVRSATIAEVPALEVHSRGELYLNEAGELVQDGRENDTAAHFELARFCERILDFEHALVHYRRARELDPEYKASELGVILERVAVKVEQQEQLEALAEIDQQKRLGHYTKALEALAAFDGRFPESPLRVDRLKLEDSVIKARTRELETLVRNQWYSWIDRLAGQAARGAEFEAALSYVDDSMSEEIAEKVAEDAKRLWPEIDADQVRQLWIERDRKAWKAASYGLGTWLLGEENALKGAPEAAPAPEAESERDQARADIREQMERFLKNQQIAKRASGKNEDEQQAVDDFWTTLSNAARKAWLVAYYAENSGDVDLKPRPELYNCPSCGGTGVLEVVYTGSAKSGSGASGLQLKTCPTCHGIGRVRRIRYR